MIQEKRKPGGQPKPYKCKHLQVKVVDELYDYLKSYVERKNNALKKKLLKKSQK